MYGAVYGDLVGSLYEYREYVRHSVEDMIKASNKSILLTKECFISDDTILTVAVAEAMEHELDFEENIRKYILDNSEPTNRDDYFKYIFSPNTIKWAKGEGNNASIGNGAIMRISPVGNLCKTLLLLTHDTIKATTPSHNSESAIKAALCVSNIIYLARTGSTKSYIKKVVDNYFPYNYDFNLDELRKGMKFNYSCDETMPLVLYVIFNTNNFDDAIRMMLSIGGDTDTNCCIVGSIAEALYGLPNNIKDEVDEYLPKEYIPILRYTNCKK